MIPRSGRLVHLRARLRAPARVCICISDARYLLYSPFAYGIVRLCTTLLRREDVSAVRIKSATSVSSSPIPFPSQQSPAPTTLFLCNRYVYLSKLVCVCMCVCVYVCTCVRKREKEEESGRVCVDSGQQFSYHCPNASTCVSNVIIVCIDRTGRGEAPVDGRRQNPGPVAVEICAGWCAGAAVGGGPAEKQHNFSEWRCRAGFTWEESKGPECVQC